MTFDDPDEDNEAESEGEEDEGAEDEEAGQDDLDKEDTESEHEDSENEDNESEEEPAWKDGGRWAIADFFEMLKNQYLELKFIPASTHKVLAEYGGPRSRQEGLRSTLKQIYQEHGWPDLERFRKEECLVAVQKAFEEHDS